MRFASLGSGSEGNALVVEHGVAGDCVRVLVDCGFTLKETERRLARISVAPQSLRAIVVTHEHGDHIAGVFKLARRYGIPVYATFGTMQALDGRERDGVEVRLCVPDCPFDIDGVQVTPYPVPHDAREPVQYVFSDGARRLGILTDTGCLTAHILGVLGGCNALVLECNHDRDLLRDSDYPPSLKNRIGGNYGHLANDVAATILEQLDRSVLQIVVAAHLSRSNNTPEMARAALAPVLGWTLHDVQIADQDLGCAWLPV